MLKARVLLFCLLASCSPPFPGTKTPARASNKLYTLRSPDGSVFTIEPGTSTHARQLSPASLEMQYGRIKSATSPYFDTATLFPSDSLSGDFRISAEAPDRLKFAFSLFDLTASITGEGLKPLELKFTCDDPHPSYRRILSLVRDMKAAQSRSMKKHGEDDLDSNDPSVIAYQKALLSYIAKHGPPSAPETDWLYVEESECSTNRYIYNVMMRLRQQHVRIVDGNGLPVGPQP